MQVPHTKVHEIPDQLTKKVRQQTAGGRGENSKLRRAEQNAKSSVNNRNSLLMFSDDQQQNIW
jgi:hypothetical protein